MTVLEALDQAIEALNGISVPVPQLQSIGMPISRAADLIQASIDALNRNTKAEEEAEETKPEESDPE